MIIINVDMTEKKQGKTYLEPRTQNKFYDPD